MKAGCNKQEVWKKLPIFNTDHLTEISTEYIYNSFDVNMKLWNLF